MVMVTEMVDSRRFKWSGVDWGSMVLIEVEWSGVEWRVVGWGVEWIGVEWSVGVGVGSG